jgi:nucleotide-binding universal stress UspA family protein
MLNLLVAVDRSLEASFALRTACFFGLKINIRPIYVYDPPSRDISLGAGWAWKTWEREVRRQAQAYIEDLLVAERHQCTNIEDPLIVMGEPVQEMAGHLWQGGFDLLLVGVPFRECELLALSRRFWQAAKKSRRDIPLLAVRHLKNIQRVVALTDGGSAAESALGILIRLSSFLTFEITLVGLVRDHAPSSESEALSLERGLAILKEKGLEATGHTAASLAPDDLLSTLKAADLVVSPYLKDQYHTHLHGLSDHEIQAVLFYIASD